MDLKKNQTYEVTIDSASAEGFGVCRIDGRAVFVPGTIPGEKWVIRLLKVTETVIWAKGVECQLRSLMRIENDCPNPCGGCVLRHVQYEEELRQKKNRVDECLRRIGRQTVLTDCIHPSPQIERYRNKAIFAVGLSEGRAAFGFYRTRSHDLIPISDCLLQSENCLHTARAVIDFMNSNGILPYDETTRKGIVRHLFYRESEKAGVLCIVAARGFGEKTSYLVQYLRDHCQWLTGIVLNINKSTGNTVLKGDFYTLWGKPQIRDILCGVEFVISPQAFFQINPKQAEAIYRKAIEYSGNPKKVLDLYCGAGTISLCFAKSGISVIGVDIVPEAIENARKNAEENHLTNVSFICADTADRKLHAELDSHPVDTIVVDPPRKGLSQPIVLEIAQLAPEKIIYVSCNPATLARDIENLSNYGYSLRKAEAFDMFPRCGHVETVCCLYHQKKDFISVPYEPKDDDYLKNR